MLSQLELRHGQRYVPSFQGLSKIRVAGVQPAPFGMQLQPGKRIPRSHPAVLCRRHSSGFFRRYRSSVLVVPASVASHGELICEPEVAVDDAKAYTKPFTFRIIRLIVTDRSEMVEYICHENQNFLKLTASRR